MITIKAVPVTEHRIHREDFYKSIDAQASDKDSYEIISLGETPDIESRIIIYLPDDCIVMGNSWDKYVLHALDNGLPKGDLDRPDTWMTWPIYIKRRLNLVDRNGNGIFPDLKVELSIATS